MRKSRRWQRAALVLILTAVHTDYRPGDLFQMTLAAQDAIAAEVVIGYRPYLELIAELPGAQQVIASGMSEELACYRTALEPARARWMPRL